MEKPIKICICAASTPEDRKYLDRLKYHLHPLQKVGMVTLWDDTQIIAGAETEVERQKQLRAANMVLLLVSADFINGDLCYSDEMNRLLERRKQGEIHLIPILIRHSNWKLAPFGHLGALPKNGKPVSSWTEREEAWQTIAQEIQDIVLAIIEPPQKASPAVTPSSSQKTLLSPSSRQGTVQQNGVQPVVQPRDPDTIRAELEVKRAADDFDVFLCYNDEVDEDRVVVKKLAQRLLDQGILPWFNEWEARPGLPWQDALWQQIGHIRTAAVCVGKDGIGPWQSMEVRSFLDQFAKRRCPVIPVILEHNNKGELVVPPSLQMMAPVDFRKSDPDPLERLLWGITGKKIPLR